MDALLAKILFRAAKASEDEESPERGKYNHHATFTTKMCSKKDGVCSIGTEQERIMSDKEAKAIIDLKVGGACLWIDDSNGSYRLRPAYFVKNRQQFVISCLGFSAEVPADLRDPKVANRVVCTYYHDIDSLQDHTNNVGTEIFTTWKKEFLEREKQYQLNVQEKPKVDSMSKQEKLWKTKKWSDVTITCTDGIIKAHKCILSNACEFFDRVFDSQMQESKTGNVTLASKMMYLNCILEYLYTDQFNFFIPKITPGEASKGNANSLDDTDMCGGQTANADNKATGSSDGQDDDDDGGAQSEIEMRSFTGAEFAELIFVAHLLGLRDLITVIVRTIILAEIIQSKQDYDAVIKIGQFLRLQGKDYEALFKKINTYVQDAVSKHPDYLF